MGAGSASCPTMATADRAAETLRALGFLVELAVAGTMYLYATEEP